MPVQVENTQTLYANQTNEANAMDMTNEQWNSGMSTWLLHVQVQLGATVRGKVHR